MLKAAIYDPQFLSSAGIEAVLKTSNKPYSIKVLDPEKKLINQIANQDIDLLVLEYVGKNPVSSEVLKQVRKEFPLLKVLIISEDDDTIEIKRRIALGIHGFLTKKCSAEEIKMTINTISEGGKFYCQRVIDIMTNQEDVMSVELTDRELQIVRLIGKGQSSTEIADKLNLSIHTINSHRKRILKKLDFKSPAELIAYAITKMKND